jgi:hypothetical protein
MGEGKGKYSQIDLLGKRLSVAQQQKTKKKKKKGNKKAIKHACLM